MRFYTLSHAFTCGVDLHGRTMYVCVLDRDGQVVLHRNMPCEPAAFLATIAPFREDLVVACECIFTWYWLADLCQDNGIVFVLGHALGMRLIHGTKSKTDRIDSLKIAQLLRSGHLWIAHVYPRELRATRDLLRRRLYFVRQRAELLAHLKMSESQYNLDPQKARLASEKNRAGFPERFPQGSARLSMASDCALIDELDTLIDTLERELIRTAKVHDLASLYRLRSIPGIGEILALTILYEVPDFDRFDTVQQFASYSRLVAPRTESSGKLGGSRARKQGNEKLKWAFSEAAVLMLRLNPPAQLLHSRLVKRFGRAKALSVLAHKIGRTVFYMQKRKVPLDAQRFYDAA